MQLPCPIISGLNTGSVEERIQKPNPDDHERASDTRGNRCECQKVHAVGRRQHSQIAGSAYITAAESRSYAGFKWPQPCKASEQHSTNKRAENTKQNDYKRPNCKEFGKRRKL